MFISYFSKDDWLNLKVAREGRKELQTVNTNLLVSIYVSETSNSQFWTVKGNPVEGPNLYISRI